MYKDKGVEIAWKILLLQGNLIASQSFYGTTFYMGASERKRWKEINMVGVNWEKTKPPEEEIKNFFIDTFADGCDKESWTLGTLILNNGESQQVGHRVDRDRDFSELVRTVLILQEDTSKSLDSIIKERAGEV